ncbi:MBL fold metallo-hydrolase [Occultella glacieicola]|uniref:MBL fold metallo-hydrolase n=1 Tax=Occultella glacieicola TaxID=2518684 RepID=A0ABY2E1Y8_9MICO|nr:MBL fold metallo-hydrolase [Occultella glacieicola]TDE91516.1 MBL fold metallo-hydrolase [Occultella glacieicola]
MRITKREHACLIVEHGDPGSGDAVLVIDPGSFSTLPDLGSLGPVAAVVLTHAHADHAHPEHLAALRDANPDAVFLGPPAVAAAVAGIGIQVVQAGQSLTVGPFELTFHGGVHARIHSSIPPVDNVGVSVNGVLYHPGDSLEPAVTGMPVLAAPVSGPWLKAGEVMDLVGAVGAAHVVPIHESHASAVGQQLMARLVGGAAEAAGGRYDALAVGESLEV